MRNSIFYAYICHIYLYYVAKKFAVQIASLRRFYYYHSSVQQGVFDKLFVLKTENFDSFVFKDQLQFIKPISF